MPHVWTPLCAGIISALALCATAAAQSTVTTDFVPYPAGTHFYGSAGVVNSEQMLKINPSGGQITNGAVQFAPQEPGQSVDSMDLTYEQYMGSGPQMDDAKGQLTGSAGMAVSFGSDLPTGTTNIAEDGVGDGLIVSFNTYWQPGAGFGDGIQVFWDGKSVFEKETGASFLRTSGFVPVEIAMSDTGEVTVDYNDKTICDDLKLPGYHAMWSPCLEFTARGWGCGSDMHCCKNLCCREPTRPDSPEPASAGMLTAVGGLLLGRRRRNKTAA